MLSMYIVQAHFCITSTLYLSDLYIRTTSCSILSFAAQDYVKEPVSYPVICFVIYHRWLGHVLGQCSRSNDLSRRYIRLGCHALVTANLLVLTIHNYRLSAIICAGVPNMKIAHSIPTHRTIVVISAIITKRTRAYVFYSLLGALKNQNVFLRNEKL